MLFEIKNALLRSVTDVTNGVSKSGNPWTKATAIFEKAEGNYTDTYPIFVFGDKVQETELYVGKYVDIKFNVQAREYNGRWYVDLGLRSIDMHDTRPVVPPVMIPDPVSAKPSGDNGSDLPF